MTTDAPAKRGRPSAYSPSVANAICVRIAEGESLLSICKDPDMPARSTVNLWLSSEDHAEFSDNFARARVLQQETIFDEAEERARDVLTNPDVTAAQVNATRLFFDVQKWRLGVMAPRSYGEKMQLEQKVDITNHYNEDDMAILDRLAQQRATDLAAKKSRKPQPQEE